MTTYSKYRSREAIDAKLDEIQGDIEYNEDIPYRQKSPLLTELLERFNPETHHELVMDWEPIGNEM
jgi:hypothetical protein